MFHFSTKLEEKESPNLSMKSNSKRIKPSVKWNHFSIFSSTDKDSNIPFEVHSSSVYLITWRLQKARLAVGTGAYDSLLLGEVYVLIELAGK